MTRAGVISDLLPQLYSAGVIASWGSFQDGPITYFRVYGNGPDAGEVIIGAESGEVFVPINQERVS